MVIASPESDEARKWVDESLSARQPVEQQPSQQVQQPIATCVKKFTKSVKVEF